MNIEQQKVIAKNVLSKIKMVDNRAIIAGGAPRDWYFNNLANDIDVFYYQEADYCTENMRNQKKLLEFLTGCEITVLGYNTELEKSEPNDNFNNYLRNPDIVNVFECSVDNVKFQFIQLKKRNVNVNKFAYNMCQAWSDGETINTTYLFKLGVQKELLIETGEIYNNTNKFKAKMMNKFPRYTYLKSYNGN